MAVKVILREVVEHLGERGEIVSVASGYARNYLYPKGFALAATDGNMKMLARRRSRRSLMRRFRRERWMTIRSSGGCWCGCPRDSRK